MPKLRSIDGEHVGHEYALGDEPLIAGRRGSNAIALKSSKSSRSHAQFGMEGARAYVKDLDSSNGTRLNGIRLAAGEQRFLSPGDDVCLAGTTLRYFTADTALPTTEIPGIELVEILAEGGMGTIYRARQTSMNREVAVKILRPEYAARQEYVNHFIQEARAAGQMNHPHIIQVHDIGKVEGDVYYFSMELVHGKNLTQLLNQPESLSLKTVIDAAAKVADALAYAHERGMIHRDVKPDNIVIADTGEVKLADLGIATRPQVDAEGNRRRILGTPHYMSPEQAAGRPVDGRSDLYSLGATIYHCIAGQPVFDHQRSTEIVSMHQRQAPPPLESVAPGTPPAVCQLVARLLSKRPDDRPGAASEVRDALQALLPTLDALARRPAKAAQARTPTIKSSPTAGRRTRSRSSDGDPAVKILLVAFAGILVAGAVVTLVYLSQDNTPPGGDPQPIEAPTEEQTTLQRAQTLIEQGEPAEAVPLLEALVRGTPDQEITDQAREALRQARQAITVAENEAEREAALATAWQQYQSALAEDDSRLAVLRERLEAIRQIDPGQNERVEREMRTVERMEADLLRSLQTEVEGLIHLRHYDRAFERVNAFLATQPDQPVAQKARAMNDRITQNAEADVAELKATAQNLLAEERFSQFYRELEDFSRNVQYSASEKTLAELRQTAEGQLRALFDAMVTEVRPHLDALDFGDARRALDRSKITFFGLPGFDEKVRGLEALVKSAEQMHLKVIELMNNSAAWQVAPDADLKPLADYAVVGATREAIRLQRGPAYTQKRWSDLTRAERMLVYRRYLEGDEAGLTFVTALTEFLEGTTPATGAETGDPTATTAGDTGGETGGETAGETAGGPADDEPDDTADAGGDEPGDDTGTGARQVDEDDNKDDWDNW